MSEALQHKTAELERLLVRAVCMVFDRYLRQRVQGAAYSRVI